MAFLYRTFQFTAVLTALAYVPQVPIGINYEADGTQYFYRQQDGICEYVKLTGSDGESHIESYVWGYKISSGAPRSFDQSVKHGASE